MLSRKFVFLLALTSMLVSSEQISLHEQDCQPQFQDILYSFHLFLQFCIHQRNLAEIVVNERQITKFEHEESPDSCNCKENHNFTLYHFTLKSKEDK